jgi:hypothetical protein
MNCFASCSYNSIHAAFRIIPKISLPTLLTFNVGKLIDNLLESVQKKDGSIRNDKADKTPRQDAMNWFACCGYSFI